MHERTLASFVTTDWLTDWLTAVGDLERSLSRLHALGVGGGTGRDAANVVLYEDAAKRRVGQLVAAMRGLRTLQDAVDQLAGDSPVWRFSGSRPRLPATRPVRPAEATVAADFR
jgi:hypothetical protein